MTSTDIAHATGLKPSTVANALMRMLAAGAVQKRNHKRYGIWQRAQEAAE